MIITNLETIEKRVKKNSNDNAKIISDFKTRLEKRGLKKGRQRPKDRTEQKILASFERK